MPFQRAWILLLLHLAFRNRKQKKNTHKRHVMYRVIKRLQDLFFNDSYHSYITNHCDRKSGLEFNVLNKCTALFIKAV